MLSVVRLSSVAVSLLLVLGVDALDNGLARTPPMGWISWERYRCQLDCKNFPDECISEGLYMRMADALVKYGYRDLGYVHVNIDDCWPKLVRDPKTNRLVADPQRFPSGIKALAKYMHDRGLKLGIYGDAGFLTCAGYPGSGLHVELDAETFAEWDVDMVKFDGCYVGENDIGEVYQNMSRALNKTGVPMLYSCEWPLYLNKLKPDYAKIAATCNIWRNYNDVDDNWDSVKTIMDFYAANQDAFVPYQGPGAFFDPDMLVLGDYGLSYDQSKAQLALWTIWASPLFMSNNVEAIERSIGQLLKNPHMIDMNQDSEGHMGKRVKVVNNVHIFARPILPKTGTSYSYGLAFVNRNEGGGPTTVSITAANCGLTDSNGYALTDIFDGNKPVGVVGPKDVVEVTVNPTGAVLLKATLNGAK